jgi:UDP-N-acetylmuramoyl-L-alanyl-D-glutamate--2,6-diaminopimelate ligase
MKMLREITEDVQIIEVVGDIDIPISGISYDTRDKIEAGGCFVAMRGTTFDGHTYIHDVVARGAHAIVCEHIENPKEGITYIKVGNTYDAIAKMSEAYFDYPSRQAQARRCHRYKW